MTTLYIAGPMTGYLRWNFDAFEAAATELRDAGYDVVSPHEHDLEAGFDPDAPAENFTEEERHAALTWDLQQVLESDGVATLDGWMEPEGAKLEVRVAQATGKTVVPVSFWAFHATGELTQ